MISVAVIVYHGSGISLLRRSSRFTENDGALRVPPGVLGAEPAGFAAVVVAGTLHRSHTAGAEVRLDFVERVGRLAFLFGIFVC